MELCTHLVVAACEAFCMHRHDSPTDTGIHWEPRLAHVHAVNEQMLHRECHSFRVGIERSGGMLLRVN
jgi:hypothetical protein